MALNNNDMNWKSIIIVAVFCILAAFGGGFAIQSALLEVSGWTTVGYGVVAGIFTAISAVIFMQVLSYLSGK